MHWLVSVLFVLLLTGCGTGGEGQAGDGDAGPVDSGEEATPGDGGDPADPGTDAGGEPDTLPDPGEAGPHSWSRTGFDLDLSGTSVPLTIYLPGVDGPCPVIVFHHGFQLETGLYASYGEHLASWGYVAILPQMPGGLLDSPNHRELKEFLLGVMDWIDSNAGDAQGPLRGKADAARLGLAGHSMGGKIALLAAAEDRRPRGVFGLDPVDAAGGPFGTPGPDYPSVTPELMDQITIPLGLLGETVNATCTGFMCQACAPEEDNFHQYYLHAAGPAAEIEVLGANHMSFLDDPDCGMTCSACPKGTDDPAVTRMLSRRYLTAFFQLVLRDDTAYRTYLTGTGMQADENAGLVTSEFKNGF
jgi:dienelactone hydrolase